MRRAVRARRSRSPRDYDASDGAVEVNRQLTRVDARFTSPKPDAGFPELERYSRGVASGYAPIVARVRSLKPPPDHAEVDSALAQGLQNLTDNIRDKAAAARERDARGVAHTLTAERSLVGTVTGPAELSGFVDCVRRPALRPAAEYPPPNTERRRALRDICTQVALRERFIKRWLQDGLREEALTRAQYEFGMRNARRTGAARFARLVARVPALRDATRADCPAH